MDAISELYGDVLEVGVGTGANIRFYPDALEVIAIDSSRKRLEKVRAKVGNRRNVTFVQMDVQDLAFPENTFDVVLAASAFCSVPDRLRGLREMRRVCKSGGKIVMLEHVNRKGRWIGWVIDFMNPVPLHAYGEEVNRHIVEELQCASFRSADIAITDLWREIFKKIVIHNRK